jgi:hypothetical protein
MPQYWLIKVSPETDKSTGAPVAGAELVAWSQAAQAEVTVEQKRALVAAEAAFFGRKAEAATASLEHQLEAARAIDEAAAKGFLKNSRRILDLEHGQFKAWIFWRN